jgi:YVTN family beta-propeller protein
VTWSNSATSDTGSAVPPNPWNASVPLIPGVNTITVTVRDTNGLTASDVLTVACDPVPPTVSVTNPPTSTLSVTSSPLAVDGTAADDATVLSVSWSSSNGTSGTATGTTVWSASIPLWEGDNTITLQASDPAGGGSTVTLNVYYDGTAPLVIIRDPTLNPSWTAPWAPMDVSGTMSDISAVASVSWSNSTTGDSGVAAGTNAWSFSTPLALGVNMITVTATDSLGWTGNDTLTVTYDPLLPFNPSPPTGGAVTQPDVTLSWQTQAAVSSYDVYLGTGASPPLFANVSQPQLFVSGLLFNTSYTWRVVAKDGSGDHSGPSWTFSTPSTLPPLPNTDTLAVTGTTVTPGNGIPYWSSLTYSWTQTAGPPVALSNPNAPDATFLMGPAPSYGFQLSATGAGYTYVDTTTIRPYLSAGTRSGMPASPEYWDASDFPIRYRINLGSYAGTASEPALISAIQAGLQEWENVSTSFARFVYEGTTTALPVSDGVNVVFADEVGTYVPGAGVAFPRTSAGGRLIEADIAWNAKPGSAYLTSPSTNLKGLLTHEGGHLLGFAHSRSGGNSAIYSNTIQLSLAPHDVAMVSGTYPEPSFFSLFGSMSGKVELTTGAPVAASICAIDTSQPQPRVYIAYADASDGSFVINGIAPGSYQLLVELSPYAPSPEFANTLAQGGLSFSVAAGADTSVGTVVVSPAPATPFVTPFRYEIKDILPMPGTGYTYVLGEYRLFIHATASNSYLNNPSLWNETGLSMSYSPATKRIAYPSQGEQVVRIVDANSSSATFNQLLATVSGLPTGSLAASHATDGSRIYVNSYFGSSVVVIDAATNQIASQIALSGNPWDVTVAPAGLRAYVGLISATPPTSYLLAEIDINPASPTFHTVLQYIPVGTNGAYYQVTDGARVFSSSRTTVDRIDLASQAVTSLDTTNKTTNLAISPSYRYLYYTAFDSTLVKNSQLRVYDTQSDAVIQTLSLSGARYDAVGISTDGSKLGVGSDVGSWLLFDILPNGLVQ